MQAWVGNLITEEYDLEASKSLVTEHADFFLDHDKFNKKLEKNTQEAKRELAVHLDSISAVADPQLN